MTENPPVPATPAVPALWQPKPFTGSDLLPLDLAGQGDRTGQENIKAEDIVLPTLQLLQGMSDPCTRGEEGAKPGVFWHNGANVALPGPLRVLAVAHTRGRALLPKANNARFSGLEMCVSRDMIEGSKYGSCDSCAHKEWGANRETPLCTESHGFVVMTKFGPALLRIALSNKQNRTTARNLLTTWNFSRKTLWSHPLQIASRQESKDMGPGQKPAIFYSLDLKWLQGEDVPPAVQVAAREIHDQISRANEAGKLEADDEVANGPAPADLGDMPF
jgi:hypothetical protein